MALPVLEGRTKRNTEALDPNLNEQVRRWTELVPVDRTGECKPLSTLLMVPSAHNAPCHRPLMLLRSVALRVFGIHGIEHERAGGSPQCFALSVRDTV